MSNCPQELKYTNSHEWIKVEGDEATVGITDHAQGQLGDIVFVELPLIEDEAMQGKEAGVVESVKTAADIYSPISGEVIAINEELTATPEMVNEDPYGNGWLFKVKMLDPGELDQYMSAEQYQEANPD
ncbi:MAG: glycine cleavage system protein H [Coxiella sp. (in: Bacteria)]|nr:MAG: glycine cleavage system protein H [Coxiella sp. (in: g-proteobacteria)]